MPAEVVTLVRLPISEAVNMLRQKHHITEAFSEVRLEDEYLAFYFVHSAKALRVGPKASADASVTSTIYRDSHTGKRRARKRRNRMKTRGWPVLTKTVNSRGQTAVIYKPFVDALAKDGLSRMEQRTAVEEILRANGNKPTETSINYFMENTIEYLKKERAKVEG